LEAFPGAIDEQPIRARSGTDPFAVQLQQQSASGTQKEEVVVKAGFLRKEGQTVKSWKKRWFVLTNDGLAYYPDNKASESLCFRDVKKK